LPFISDNHQSNILNEIRDGGKIDESYVGKLAGNKYGKCIAGDIKLCSCCLEEDKKYFGSAYIHLEHQFAFVHDCNKHSVKLFTHCYTCGDKLGYSALEGTCRQGHALIAINSEHSNLNREIQKDLETLYKNHEQLSVDFLRQRLFEHLNARGYLSLNGKTQRKLLVQDFLNYYSLNDLSSLGLSSVYINQKSTFEKIIWGDSLVINLPLVLLLIRFLSGNFENFITLSYPYSMKVPFGIGPWQCENENCPDFKEFVIDKCVRFEDKYKKLLGKFCCDTCNTEYVKEWSWTKGERRKKVWSEFKAPDKTKINSKKDYYRSKLIAVIQEYPGLKRYDICLKCTSAYGWLKKYDNAWLENQLPPSKSNDRFDWKEVDDLLSKRVKEIAEQLISSNPKTRVGPYSIMSELNKAERGRIKTYSHHLPQTMKMLQEVAETKEQYQIGHLPALVWQLKTHYDYQVVTIDAILSYRRSYRGITEETKRMLAIRLLEIQSL